MDVGDVIALRLQYQSLVWFDSWSELQVEDVSVTSGVTGQNFRSESEAAMALKSGEEVEASLQHVLHPYQSKEWFHNELNPTKSAFADKGQCSFEEHQNRSAANDTSRPVFTMWYKSLVYFM